MELPVNTFKRGLSQRHPQFGTWLMSASPNVAEAIGCVGYDFVVVDMEHVPIDVPQAFQLLQAIAGTPAHAIVRLPWNEFVVVKRVLDAGAQTLMYPYVQNAEEAERAVAATRYPPRGIRGVAAMHRAGGYGTVSHYYQRAEDEICVVIQIETLAAVSAMAEIAKIDGVDALFVGPGDLSGTMGLIGDTANPTVQAELARAAASAKEVGKPCGILAATVEMAHRYLEMGYTYVAIASDMAMMMSRADECLAALKAATADELTLSPQSSKHKY